MFGSKVEKIAKLAEKKKGEKIAGYLDSKDREVVMAAIAGLGKAADEASYNALVPLVRNPDAEIRAAAAAALGVTGNSQARTHLAYQLKNESDGKVQQALRDALDVLPLDRK